MNRQNKRLNITNKAWLCGVFAALMAAIPVWAVQIDVPGDQPSIQAGIDASADGDVVLVQAGTYVENIHFNGKNITVISADGPETTIIDGNRNGTVATLNGEGPGAKLSGFTITNGSGTYENFGYAFLHGSYYGGGLFCNDSRITLENLIVSGNFALAGGGIYCKNSSPVLINVTVTNNSADFGGGIYFINSNPDFDSSNRSNIYLNHAGSGNDLYSNQAIDVILDIFTVMVPTGYHAVPIENFSFDISGAQLDRPQVNADLYVSPDGDDSNSGLSREEPLKTIDYALSIIQADASAPRSIYLAPGVFSAGTNGEKFPVSMSSHVSLRGSGERETILNAGRTSTVVMVYRVNGPVFIEDLSITKGRGISDTGGGVLCTSADLQLANVTISHNEAVLGSGGGIRCSSSNLALENVVISDNKTSGNYGNGGGIYLGDDSSSTLMNVKILNNRSHWSGGGIYGTRVFAETSFEATITITNTIISGNIAGGGIYNDGGAVVCRNVAMNLINVTIADNSADDQGDGLHLEDVCRLNMVNSILWNNSPEEISFSNLLKPSNMTVSYSNVQGGQNGIVSYGSDKIEWLENIDADPLFVNAAEGDYHLISNSPARDTGTSDDAPLYDIEGNPRIRRPDMGAYEIIDDRSAGYAILVQGRISNDEGAESYEKTLNRAYRKLRKIGFPAANIRSFSYAATDNVSAIPDKTKIQESIEIWAVEQMNEIPAPLYLILLDHGDPEKFYMTPDFIDPGELDGWLNILEDRLTEIVREQPRVVIIGTCYSGSFIPSVSAAGRIVITSAAHDELSFKGMREADGIRAGEYFVEEFIKRLTPKTSLKEAFEQAARRTGEYVPHHESVAMQHPLLDDNADGIGSNILMAGGDGEWSSRIVPGIDYETNGPTMIPATPTRYLSADESKALLYINANGKKADVVSMEIHPPSPWAVLEPGTESTEQLEVDFPTVIPQLNPDTGRFEYEYDDFTEPGKYKIFYVAENSRTGEVFSVNPSIVYKDRPDNRPPGSFQLLSPMDGAMAPTVLILDWQSSGEPDGEALTYTLTIAKDADFNTVFYHREELDASMIFLDDAAGLADLASYYWRVEAVDEFGARTAVDKVFRFNTDNTSGGFSGVDMQIRGILDLYPFAKLQVTIDPKPIIAPFMHTEPDRVMFKLGDGMYNFEISAAGYQPATVQNVAVMAGKITHVNVLLEPPLPYLGKGVMIINDGVIAPVNATFRGGIAVNGGAYQPTAKMHHTDNAKITGEIIPDIAHRTRNADILIAAGYKPLALGASERFFMRTVDGGFSEMNHAMSGLAAYQNITLAANQPVTIYEGKLPPGNFRIFFGYRLTDGTVVFNGKRTIGFTVY